MELVRARKAKVIAVPMRIRSFEAKIPFPRRILDLDVECVSAGFDDPEWVPRKITCAAWSWIGSNEVQCTIATPLGLMGKPELRRQMLEPLLAEIEAADMLTGQNILRFDLPLINAECLRLGLPLLPKKLVQDTKRIAKTLGFKKGQDNMGDLLGVRPRKIHMSWQAWQDAYDEDGWESIKKRAITDVKQHKKMRAAMLRRGWLRPPVMWNPLK